MRKERISRLGKAPPPLPRGCEASVGGAQPEVLFEARVFFFEFASILDAN